MKFVIFAFLVTLACAFATPIDENQPNQTDPNSDCAVIASFYGLYGTFADSKGIDLEEIKIQ